MPFRYLGIPLAAERLRSADFSTLIDSIIVRLNSWPRRTLSYAGKVELIRSVLQGVECFWLSILPIPFGIIDKIYSVCRAFVWNSKHPPISWASLCNSKEEGGVGLRDLRCWNKSLLAKVLWDIHTRKESLWVRWIHHIYLGRGDLWTWSARHIDSPLIKKILCIRDELLLSAGSSDRAMHLLSSWFSATGSGANQAYRFFKGRNPKVPWATVVWNSCILPKHAFTLWLGALGKLLTRDRLPFAVDKGCVLCHSVEESIRHLFFDCSFSRRLWNRVRAWLNIRFSMTTLNSTLKWFKKAYRGTSRIKKARVLGMSCTVYHIWSARNGKLFENLDPDKIFGKIQLHVFRCLYFLFPLDVHLDDIVG